MELLSLEIENFMGFRECRLDLTVFQSALVVAKGVNNDRYSNGSGKSTIFKAIEYVLFGEYESDTVDKIVRWGTTQAKVTLSFKLNDETYRITRGRNKKSARSDLLLSIMKDGQWQDLGQKTNSELEAEIAKLIKINFRSFRNSVLFAQDDLVSLTSVKSPQDRKNILKDVLSLAIYSKLEKIAKEKIATVNRQIQNTKVNLAALGSPEAELLKLNEELKSWIESRECSTAQKILKQEDIFQAKLKISNDEKLLSNESLELDKKRLDWQTKKQNAQSNHSSIQSSITTKDRELQSYFSKIEEEKALIAKRQAESEVPVAGLADWPTLKTDITQCREGITSRKVKIQVLKDRRGELSRPLPEGHSCPHCRQVVTAEHRDHCRQQAQQEINSISQEIIKLENELAESQQDLLAKESKSSQIEVLNSSRQNLLSSLENKRNHLSQMEKMYLQMQEAKQHLEKNLASSSTSLAEITSELQKIEERVKNLNIEQVRQDLDTSRTKLTTLEQENMGLEKQASYASTQIGILETRITACSENKIKIISLQEDLTKLEKELYHRQLALQGFGSGGIPAMIIHTILDDLQIEANKFLDELRPGFQMQFSIIKIKNDGSQEDTLDISYILHGNPCDYSQLSGGQKFMAALCLRLGLATVIQRRLGVDIQFLELDEVDEKLDKAAVDALAFILKRLQDRFKIMVVTHNDQLKDKFSHAILIEYDEIQGSTARIVNSW